MKRIIAFIIIAALTISSVSGCIPKDQAAKVAKSNNIVLTYYKLFDDEDVIKPMIQAYTSKHPNVQIVYKKFTDPVEYESLIVNQLAEGEGPDLFSAPNYWFLRNVRKLSPMPESMMTVKQYGDQFVSVAQNDLVLRDPADGAIRIFGVPMFVDTLALYYNKAQFDDKLPSQGKPSATWEGIKNDVFQLTKKDQSFERFEVAGLALGRADNIARATDILLMMLLQYKTKFYNENISQASFAHQVLITGGGSSITPAIEAMKMYTSFALPSNKNYSWNQYISDPNSDTKELETFARGKVSMIFGYSYLYDQIGNEVKDLTGKGVSVINPKDVKIAYVPQVEDPTVSTDKRVAYASYYAETVSRTSKNADVAWDFLNFITSKDNLKFYNEKTKRPTSRRDMIQDQIKDPVYGVFAEQIGFAESLPIYDYLRYQEIFTDSINSVLSTVSPDDAIKNAEDKINKLLPAEGLIPPAPQATSTVPGSSKKASTQQK